MQKIILLTLCLNLFGKEIPGDNPEFFYEFNNSQLPIAVVDTGVDYNHKRVRNHIAPEIGYDYLKNDNLPYDFRVRQEANLTASIKNSKLWKLIPSDGVKVVLEGTVGLIDDFIDGFGKPGHGTCVSDVIIQTSATDVAIASYRWGKHKDTNQHIINGIEKAIRDGSKIINLSLGINYKKSEVESPAVEINTDLFKRKFIKIVEDNPEVVFIIASGNSGFNMNSSNTVALPAKINRDNIITVGALDFEGDITYFSNYGSDYVDVYAPGQDIECAESQAELTKKSGTSFSAPFVAAKLRDLWLENENYSANKVVKEYLNSLNMQWLNFADYPEGFPETKQENKPLFNLGRVDT